MRDWLVYSAELRGGMIKNKILKKKYNILKS